MDKPIKIAMVANNLGLNGISTVIVNYCTHIDPNRFHIVLFAGEPVNPDNKKKCLDAGAEFVLLPSKKKDSRAFFRALDRGLKDRAFDIFHVHGNGTVMSAELAIAKHNHIRHRIAHSHNTTSDHIKLNYLLRPIFNSLYTDAFACGKAAGHWLFQDKNFTVIPNGFDIEKFKFDADVRSKVREKLGIQDDEFVIGHIGRVNHQKNQKFLLDIFNEIVSRNDKARLLIVGRGPDYEEISQLVENSPFNERIILYGESIHPEELYSAMDEFVFPSLYEGLPVTLLEAQINGLPCTISDVITDEVIINDNIIQEKLDSGADEWSLAALKNSHRLHADLELFSSYRIEKSVRKLEKEYQKIMEK